MDKVMPFVILNLGSEMIYVLDQRLTAQQIPADKAQRVLVDVINAMLNVQFLGELFRPQRIYNHTATRQIFDRLAHSSIMRLNSTSMDKLYDLMSMGFKYQILSINEPCHIMSITYNHLDNLRRLGSKSNDLVIEKASQLLSSYSQCSYGQWALIRYQLMVFFQDHRIKVSLFLNEGFQANDGSIILSHRGTLPTQADFPGTLKYFDENGIVKCKSNIDMPNASGLQPMPPQTDISQPFAHRPTTLGRNLYASIKRPSPSATVVKPSLTATAIAGTPSTASVSDAQSSAAAKKELNVLAQMIGGANFSNESDKFTLSGLFSDDDDIGVMNVDSGVTTVTFKADTAAAREARVANTMKDVMHIDSSVKNSSSTNSDVIDDDLLDLMDKAK